MVDHRTGPQKTWSTVAGVVLLVAGVVLGALFYDHVPMAVLAAVVAVSGLGLLRYALLRRPRSARG